MAGKPVKKHGVTTRQLVAEVPEGCSLPDFEQKPVTMALAEGRNAVLRAVVCGEPPPQVRWRSSKGDLSDSSKFQLLSAPGSREHALQISKLTGEDTDKYYCIAENPYGEAVCSARLTVIEVGFRKKRKRATEPQEDLSKELMDLRRMLRKSAPPPKKKMDPEQVWQLLMSADRKDYERLCIQYGIADFRGMLRKLEKMRRERADRMAQYVNTVSNTKHMKVTKEGVAFFELDLDLKDPESNVYLYKDGEMIPYGSESHSKRSARRLGKHYHFQIQDLWPEDAGLYQVKVEDAEVFSTELEASAIPPRVVVPLSEARCEEQGDAVFECVLSSPCPLAAWHFKHQPLQLGGKYEVSVSPDGLTHRLAVRGARLSDMGPYSLDTGLHVSSAWLVVEPGQDQGLLTTGADHQVQGQGAPASDAQESSGASGERGAPREQGGAPGGAGLDPGRQFPAGLDGGGLGGHSYSSVGGEGAAGAAWGPGQAGKGFPEADRFGATVSGDSQRHREGGGGDTSLPGGLQSQGEGAGSGLGLAGGHGLDGGRDGGPVGGWGARGLGGRGEGQEGSGDSRGQLGRHSQGQLGGAQLGPGTGTAALQGSRSGPGGPGAGGEGMERLLQEESPGGVGGKDALSRERGSGEAWGAWGSGAGLGASGEGSVAGGPGALGFPEGRGPGSEAGRGPGSWGSGGRGDEDPGDARGLGGPGSSPGQMPAGQDSQGPAIPGGRDPLWGHGSPEGSRQEGGPGGPGGWGGEGQGTGGAWGEAGDGRTLPSSQGEAAGPRGAGGAGRMGAGSSGPWGDMGSGLSQAGAHPGPGGGRGGVDGTQAPGLMGSGPGGDASSHGLTGAPGRGAQGPGATGSGPYFWNGAQNSGEGGPGGDRGAEAGLVGSRYGDGSGYLRGTGPGSGAGSRDGSGALGEVGSAWGVGAPGGAEAEEGGAHRGGSRGPGAMRPGDQDGHGPAGRGPGTPAGGGGGEETGVQPGGPGEAGPGGRRRPSGGLGTSATVGAGGEGHVGAEPGGSAREGGWAGGSGGPSATEPGSLRAGGGGGSGEGPRGPKAQAPGSGVGSDRGHSGGSGVPGPQHIGGSGGPGRGGIGPGGEAGFRDGSGGLGGVGSGSGAGHRGGEGGSRHGDGSGYEAGYRNGLGAPEGMGSGAQAGHRDGIGGAGGKGSGSEAGYKDGIGGVGGMGSGSEAGYRDGTGGVGGMGSGAQAGYKDGIGGVGGMGSGSEAGYKDGIGGAAGKGSGSEAGYRDGLGAPGEMGSGAQAGYKDGTGGVGGMGSGAQAGYRDGIGGAAGKGSGSEAGYRDGLGAPGGVGSGAQAGYKDGIGGVGGMGSGAQAGYKDGIGGVGGMGSGAQAGHRDGTGGAVGKGSGSEAGYRDGLGAPGGVGSGAQAGYRDGIGGVGGMGSGSEAGHRGGPGGSGETGPEGEWGSGGDPGRRGVAGALASAGQEGGPKGREAGGHGAGSGAASEGPYGGPGSEGGRAPGLVNGAGPGVGSGLPGAAGAGGSASSGAPGSPGDRGAPRGKGGSADQAGAVGAPGCLDGRGAMEGAAWAGPGAPGSRGGDGSRKAGAGAGTADRGGADAQGGPGPRGAGDSQLGGGGVAAASGTGTGEARDGGRGPGQRGKSALASADGPGVSRARAPGRGDQGPDGGRAGAGSQPPGSGVDGAAFGGTQEGPGAAGPGEAGGRQRPGARESRGSGAGSRRRPAGPRDVDGARDGLEGPAGSKDSGDRSTDAGGSGSPPGRGRRGGRGTRGAEDDQAPTEDGAPRGSRSRTRSGATAGGAERRALEEAGGRGPRPGAEDDAGSGGEAPREDGSPAGSRGASAEGRPGAGGRGQDAPRSPRGRHKLGTGCFCEEARAPQGHFSRGLADTEARLGEAVTLSCTLSRDLGPGAWFKDGVQLSAQDELVLEQEGLVRRLLIAHAQGAHAGRYSFVAGDQKSEATLTVRDPPVIAPDVMARLKEPLVVKAGKPLSVKVAFESRLPVQAAWTKDGAAVDGTGGREAQVALGDGFARLCLPSASRRDGGQYSVTLRSQGGSVRAGLTLHVIDKPQPPQGPLEVQDCRGAGVCLRWGPPRDDGGRAVERYVVERRQAGRSTWLKVGEPPADATSFTDAQVEQGKKYAFRVRAVTSEGPGEALESEEVLVAPEARPGPPSAPAILSASSQSITLSWTAPRGPGSAHILGYLVDKRKKGSNTWAAVTEQPVPERRCTVTDLRHGCQYEFRVTAVAPSGPGQPGPPSDPVFARDPMRPPGPVRDLQVTDTSHTSISLRWAAPDAQDADEAQGYVVELCPSDSLEWAPCHVGTVPGTAHTAKGLRPRAAYFVRVVAVNEGGRGEPAVLDVVVHAMPPQVSPRFLVDASTQDTLVVRVGDTIRVPVRFEAAPLPEVTWLKDGLPLSQRSVTSTEDGLTQLLVPAAGLSDSGLYRVVLRGPQGQEATHTFTLRVAARPQAPGPIHLQENVPGTVTAAWEPSPDEARGVPLHYTVLMRSAAHGPWREVADRVHTTRFTFLGVVPGHEYHFRVVAKTELGASEPSDTGQPWCLPRRRDKVPAKAPSYREPDRGQKPWFLVGLRSHLLPAGCECCMSCAVRGCPPPRVTWFRNGESLEGRRGLYSTDTLGVCSLVIPGVGPEDSGLYKAVAENALGQAISTATLLVTDPSS